LIASGIIDYELSKMPDIDRLEQVQTTSSAPIREYINRSHSLYGNRKCSYCYTMTTNLWNRTVPVPGFDFGTDLPDLVPVDIHWWV